MKKLFLASIIFLLSSISSKVLAQYDYNWALGFRVGEPLGVNIRKYFQNGDKAFDVNIGTYGFIYNRNRSYNKGEYRTAGVMLQGIYLWHTQPFGKEWFHAYYGFGGQINSRNHYSDNLKGQPVNYEKKLSLGPAGTGGIEIKTTKQELAFFLDGGLYVEALPSPLFYNWQVSAGLRLNLLRQRY